MNIRPPHPNYRSGGATACFKYVDFVKRVIIQASNIAKRLGNNILVILLKDRSNWGC